MGASKGPKRGGIYSSFYNNTEYDSVIKAAKEIISGDVKTAMNIYNGFKASKTI